MIAQVDEQHAAVIAHAMHPSGEPHGLADVALAQGAAGVGSIAMHDCPGNWEKARGKAHAGLDLSRKTAPRQPQGDLPTVAAKPEANNAADDYCRGDRRRADRAWARHDLRAARGAERSSLRCAVQGARPDPHDPHAS